MCGRYFFQLSEQPLPLIQNHEQIGLFDFCQGEIYPTQKTLVITENNEQIVGSVMKWGIKGYYGQVLINARSESINERKMFRSLLNQRCLIVANGFYEWSKHDNHKDKIFIRKKHQPYLLMAGIYNDQNEYVIITGAAQDEMAKIHLRTPILIDEHQGLAYLKQALNLTVDNRDLVFQKV